MQASGNTMTTYDDRLEELAGGYEEDITGGCLKVMLGPFVMYFMLLFLLWNSHGFMSILLAFPVAMLSFVVSLAGVAPIGGQWSIERYAESFAGTVADTIGIDPNKQETAPDWVNWIAQLLTDHDASGSLVSVVAFLGMSYSLPISTLFTMGFVSVGLTRLAPAMPSFLQRPTLFVSGAGSMLILLYLGYTYEQNELGFIDKWIAGKLLHRSLDPLFWLAVGLILLVGFLHARSFPIGPEARVADPALLQGEPSWKRHLRVRRAGVLVGLGTLALVTIFVLGSTSVARVGWPWENGGSAEQTVPSEPTGSLIIRVLVCPAGMTANDLDADRCRPVTQGFEIHIARDRIDRVLTLSDARALSQQRFRWTGLPYGRYTFNLTAFPRDTDIYYIAPSAARGSPERGYVVTIGTGNPDVQFRIYTFRDR